MLNFFTAQNYLYAKLPAIATNGDFFGEKQEFSHSPDGYRERREHRLFFTNRFYQIRTD